MGWFFKRKKEKALEEAKEEEKKDIPSMDNLKAEEKILEADEKQLDKILKQGDLIKPKKK